MWIICLQGTHISNFHQKNEERYRKAAVMIDTLSRVNIKLTLKDKNQSDY